MLVLRYVRAAPRMPKLLRDMEKAASSPGHEVQEVWNSLDPEGSGFIEVPQLLRRFDVRRLPDVKFGREEVQAAGPWAMAMVRR
eukprot:Skav201205  [mRNA]  locus=scaffold633:624200:626612:- [translate_table: standard]